MFTQHINEIFLISIRLLPLLVIAPVIGFSRVPIFIRVILTLALSVILSGLVTTPQASLNALLCFNEFVLGMVIAFGFHTAFASLDFFGKLLDLQMGINTAGVFDPLSSNLTGLMSDFLLAIAGILFFTLNLHHTLLRAMATLVSAIPLGTFQFGLLNVKAMLAVMGHQFLFSFIILLPVIVGVWLVDIGFAIMSRSMPQANIYFLSLPVKFAVGIMILMVSLPLIIQNMARLYEQPLKMTSVAPSIHGRAP